MKRGVKILGTVFALGFFVIIFFFPPKVQASTVLDTTSSVISNDNCLNDNGNDLGCILQRYYFDTGEGYPINSTELLESITLKVDPIGFMHGPTGGSQSDFVGIKVQGTVSGQHVCFSDAITYADLNANNNQWTEVTFYCDPEDTIDFALGKIDTIYSSEWGGNLHFALTSDDLITPTSVPEGNFVATYCYIYAGGPGWCAPGAITDRDVWMSINGLPAGKDPVIIIPGIMGSWEVPLEGWQLDPILNTYDNLWEALKLAGYTEDKTLFAFPYEWRFTNAYTGILLKEKIQEVKQICGCDKVDIVAHSMGGLVVRSYIEGSNYQDDIDQLIFLAVPHKGATKTYLTWEGGDLGIDKKDSLVEKILTLEAIKNGYASIYNYVRKFPIQSVQELLPIYNYLRDKDTAELRIYPNNYPTNIFLEILNNPAALKSLDNVRMVNIIADAGAGSTIDTLRVVNNWLPLDSKWEYGKPENYNTPFTDHGLEYGQGDTTVPERSNRDFMGLDNVVIESSHNGIVTDAQKRVIKELTGVEPSQEVRMNIFNKFLLVRIFSPADFVIIAPDGKKVGKDFISGQAISEIPGAFYSGFDSDIEFAVVPNPLDGEYQIELQGMGDGEYTLSASFIDDEQNIDRNFTGNIQTGQSQQFDLVYNSEEEEPISNLEPVDNTPPVITVNFPLPNEQYLHNDILTIDYSTTDDLSGVASTTVLLNNQILATTTVDLFDYNLGTSTLRIITSDNAGNQAEALVSFEVIASINSTIADIEIIYERGWITKKTDRKLLVRQLKYLERSLKRIDRQINRLEKSVQKIEDNQKINPKKKQKVLKWLGRRLTKIEVRRQRTIKRRTDVLERTLNRIKRKNRINERGYYIIINNINYLKENL